MSDITLGEMTELLQWTGIALAILVVLLILIKISQIVLRWLVRQQLATTDLDLVGQNVLVIQVIRPHRPGKIRFRTAGGDRVAEAASDQVIRGGKTVLITAVHQGRFRVVPDIGKIPAETKENTGNAEHSIRPSHIELAEFDEQTDHAGHATLAVHIKLTKQAASSEYTELADLSDAAGSPETAGSYESAGPPETAGFQEPASQAAPSASPDGSSRG